MRQGTLWHQEFGLLGPAIDLLGAPHLLLPERGTVCLWGILELWRTVANMRAHNNQRRSLLFLLGMAQCRAQRLQVVGLLANVLHMPVITGKTLGHVIRIGQLGWSFDADMVVIIDVNQLPQPKV